MSFHDELELLVGEHLWRIDNLRINLTNMGENYNKFVKNVEKSCLTSILPKKKKNSLFKKKKRIFKKTIQPLTIENYRQFTQDHSKQDILEEIYEAKMNYILKYPNHLIEHSMDNLPINNIIYEIGFIYSISIFESFNHAFFKLLQSRSEDFKKKTRKIQKRNLTNIDNFAKILLKYGNLSLSDFIAWGKLRLYYYIRNLIVHTGGVIDMNFGERFPHYNKNVNEKFKMSYLLFENQIYIICKYFLFIQELNLEENRK